MTKQSLPPYGQSRREWLAERGGFGYAEIRTSRHLGHEPDHMGATRVIRTILRYPDPRLRERSAPVEGVTPAIRQLVADMIETMRAVNGAALAAPQVGELLRIVVLGVGTDPSGRPVPLRVPRVCVNPEILSRSGSYAGAEGCLSFPGIRESIERSRVVQARALDVNGVPFDFVAEGFTAAALQHEIDHLDGVLFLDRMSERRRQVVERIMERDLNSAAKPVKEAKGRARA